MALLLSPTAPALAQDAEASPEASEQVQLRVDDDGHTVIRDASEAPLLAWVVMREGQVLLDRSVTVERDYDPSWLAREAGEYTVHMTARVDGRDQRVSNQVTITVGEADLSWDRPGAAPADDAAWGPSVWLQERTIHRQADPQQGPPDRLGWRIRRNGEVVLARVATRETSCDLRAITWRPGRYTVELTDWVGGRYARISNEVRFVVEEDAEPVAPDPLNVGPAQQIALQLDADGRTIHRGPKAKGLGTVYWVLTRDGEQLVQTHASGGDAGAFRYWLNEPGTYRVWLRGFVDGGLSRVSDVITYTVDETPAGEGD
jgi:hypothetical protein